MKVEEKFNGPIFKKIPSFKDKSKGLPEILNLLHSKSAAFSENPYLWYRKAKLLSPKEAKESIPLFLQFLKDHPYETAKEPYFQVGLAANPAIHDVYIEAVLAETQDPKENRLVGILSDAYFYKNPELVKKVLVHPDLISSKRLFEVVFSNGSLSDLAVVVERFGKEQTDLLNVLFRTNLELERLKELVGFLQDKGFDIKVALTSNPMDNLVYFNARPYLEYLLSFLSEGEQRMVLDAALCLKILYMALIDPESPKEKLQPLLDLLLEKNLPVAAILNEKEGYKNETFVEKAVRLGIDEDTVNLLKNYSKL